MEVFLGDRNVLYLVCVNDNVSDAVLYRYCIQGSDLRGPGQRVFDSFVHYVLQLHVKLQLSHRF